MPGFVVQGHTCVCKYAHSCKDSSSTEVIQHFSKKAFVFKHCLMPLFICVILVQVLLVIDRRTQKKHLFESKWFPLTG